MCESQITFFLWQPVTVGLAMKVQITELDQNISVLFKDDLPVGWNENHPLWQYLTRKFRSFLALTIMDLILPLRRDSG
jgi:hypothetical protein